MTSAKYPPVQVALWPRPCVGSTEWRCDAGPAAGYDDPRNADERSTPRPSSTSTTFGTMPSRKWRNNTISSTPKTNVRQPPVLASTYGRYRELAEAAGWTPDESYFDAARPVYVAEDEETAREEAEEPLRYFYEDLLGAVFKADAVQAVGDSEYREENAFAYEDAAPEKGQRAMNFDFDAFRERGEIIVGDPASVVEGIESLYEATGGFGNLVASLQFGTLSDELTRKNLELFADEVLPAIESL